MEGEDVKYYRYPIHAFDFTALDGKDRWTAYKLVVTILNDWMPPHFQKLRSAINLLSPVPGLAQGLEPQFPEASGISQELERHHLSESNADSASLPERHDSQSSPVDPPNVTPNTSITEQGEFKKLRRKNLKR